MKKLMLLALLVSAPYLYCMDIESAGEENSMQEETSPSQNGAMQEEKPGRIVRRAGRIREKTSVSNNLSSNNAYTMEEEKPLASKKRTKHFAEDDGLYNEIPIQSYYFKSHFLNGKKKQKKIDDASLEHIISQTRAKLHGDLEKIQSKIGTEDVFKEVKKNSTKYKGIQREEHHLLNLLALEYLQFVHSKRIGITKEDVKELNMSLLWGSPENSKFHKMPDNKYYYDGNIQDVRDIQFISDSD